MRFSIAGLIIGALVALIVYAVGTAISDFRNEDLIWGIVAVLIWIAIAFNFDGSRIGLRP